MSGPDPAANRTGGEVCGTVAQVGDGVSGWEIGQRVIGLMDHGGRSDDRWTVRFSVRNPLDT
ncbi:alcohol dehydrogenase catalytic domain-containing protein [Azospirillum lipoferum]|uniref:alcohol dehydrogenase catalytic domain-containing protein n=1 Tax=Azospirillum lipoferum TaxID=193 RepID=UPI003F4FE3F4